MDDDLPDSLFERAIMLQNILVAKAAGDHSKSNQTYVLLRQEFMSDAELKGLLPSFVRTCRDLDHFWGYAKGVSPSWEPRRQHVRDSFAPLLDRLEERRSAPPDATTSSALSSFDAESVHAVWEKALNRRATDPEGAITSARTLLETVCKKILDDAQKPYDENDDLPKLYRLAAQVLNLAPDQHVEEAFRRILGGCTSVVEGLGTLRNKIGDAHGRGGRPVRPTERHAKLAVNLAGTMATFLVETWQSNRA